tara:strand:- start:415 stop:831 length:417 start_codon:yes stop_codon:yes gene_type:complete
VKKSRTLTAPELHDLLLEAAETDRRLPAALRKTPGAWWPEIAHDWMAYPDATTTTRLPRATAEQISNYDFIHEVVLSVPDANDRVLLWAVAASAAFRHRGPAWTRIAKIQHTDRRRVKSVYEAVLVDTVMRWNRAIAA